MSRDYKHAAGRKPKKSPASSWPSFISGLGLGLFVALAVFLHRPKPVAPVTASATAQTPATKSGASSKKEAAVSEKAPQENAAVAAKPRFDFYTILPEMEVKVPEWQLGTAAGERETPRLEPGSYVLQIGSFQRFEEADRAKANLALYGITAEIQRVVINGGDTWFRVRIGPLKELGEVQTMRGKLIEHGMDFMLLRIKEGQT